MADVSTLIAVEQVLAEWIPPHASVAVAAQETYVGYKPGGLDLRLKPGDKVRPGSVAEQVLRSGRRVETEVDASVYGVPYRGVGYPLPVPSDSPAALVVILPPQSPLPDAHAQIIMGRDGELWRPAAIHDIAWFESYDKHTWMYTKDGKYTTIFTLRSLEARLPRTMFVRIHRSFLVNVHWIQAVGRDIRGALYIQMRPPYDGHRLPIAHSMTREVRMRLGF